jgi:hypothetical protein
MTFDVKLNLDSKMHELIEYHILERKKLVGMTLRFFTVVAAKYVC